MPTYLDYNATSPVDPRVVDAMLPYLAGPYGNPSSVHRYGRAARAAIDLAREQVAALVGAEPKQVVFTGGGSEANNLAIKGAAARLLPGSVCISAIEHPSIIEAAQSLGQSLAGWRCEHWPVDGHGVVMPPANLPDDLRLASVMLVNNETGAIQPVSAIAETVHGAGALMHTDAVQAAGKIPVDFAALNVDLLTLSAHKFGGPKGIGALIATKTVQLAPLIHGGGQEQGLRSGTENLPAIVGFGAAAALAQQEQAQHADRLRALRIRLEQGLDAFQAVTRFSDVAERLPNTVQFSLAGIDGETLLMKLDQAGFAVSAGSACSAEKSEPSHVLMAMGVDETVAQGAIRVSLGPENTDQDVDGLLAALGGIAASLASR